MITETLSLGPGNQDRFLPFGGLSLGRQVFTNNSIAPGWKEGTVRADLRARIRALADLHGAKSNGQFLGLVLTSLQH